MVIRIAVASFSHETCTFCPNITTLEAWEEGGIRYGPQVLDTEKEGENYITGFKKAAADHPDVELLQFYDLDIYQLFLIEKTLDHYF